MPDTNHLLHFHLDDIEIQHVKSNPCLKHTGADDYTFGIYG